ncbi:phosphonate/organophosphate ester transporter subunit [compost metagenome]
MVSLHQVDVALRYCPRVVALRHGKVVYDGRATDLTPEMLRDLYGSELSELLPEYTQPSPALAALPTLAQAA